MTRHYKEERASKKWMTEDELYIKMLLERASSEFGLLLHRHEKELDSKGVWVEQLREMENDLMKLESKVYHSEEITKMYDLVDKIEGEQ